MKPKSPWTATSLRKRAKAFLKNTAESVDSFPIHDPKQLIQELSIYQAELELQNEELRRTQEELETSRAKYFDLYDLAPVGHFTLTEDCQISEANLTAARLLETEKSRLLKKPFSLFVAAGSQDVFYFHRRKVIQSGTQQTCELELLKKNGNPVFVLLESMFIPSFETGGNRLRLSVIDIHEKKLAADMLKEVAARNELLLDSLHHPALLIDKDRKILAANQLAKRNGAEIGNYWVPDTVMEKGPVGLKGGASLAKGMTPQKDGTTKTVRVITNNQTFIGGVFSITDGEQNQQRLVTVIEDSNDAITVVDLQGKIKAWNQGAEKIYGYSASQALKMTIFDLIPPRLKTETQNFLDDIKSGVLVQPFETRRIAKDGCLLDIRLTVTRLIQNKKIVGVATTERDITDYNKWLTSIKELPQRIILAQEGERKRISQEIHSDFGQSLMALKIFLSMSATECIAKDPQAQSLFEQAKDQLNHIIEKARDLSHKLAPPSLEYIGLVEAIKKLVESTQYDKKRKIHFFHRNMGNVHFKAKDIIIYRIVQEALNNIYKHSRATAAWIKAQCLGSKFCLEVKDNGRGFDSAKKNPSKGLGLDLMKEQVALIHGTLSIKSKPGKGTSVKVIVPIKSGSGRKE